MKVTLRTVGPVALEATASSGGQAIIDGKPEIGGEDRGMRPMEALLTALASCAAMDVLYILRKQRQTVDELRVEVEGERADAVPAPFTRVHLRFVARGAIEDKKLARAVKLSVEKYCSVGVSLHPDIEVTFDAVREG